MRLQLLQKTKKKVLRAHSTKKLPLHEYPYTYMSTKYILYIT